VRSSVAPRRGELRSAVAVGLVVGGEFLLRLAGPDAGRALRHDVRARSGVLVAGFDEDPAMSAGPCEAEATAEFVAV
jgi:hypothetical protein